VKYLILALSLIVGPAVAKNSTWIIVTPTDDGGYTEWTPGHYPITVTPTGEDGYIRYDPNDYRATTYDLMYQELLRDTLR
jgi:hypothetical protein